MELAFLAPAFILLIFFTIQGSLFFYGRNVAIQSAREGVSKIRLARDSDDYAAATQYTRQFARSVGREALIDPQVDPTYNNRTGRVSMTVEGDVITLVPMIKLHVTERAEGSVERFQGPGDR